MFCGYFWYIHFGLRWASSEHSSVERDSASFSNQNISYKSGALVWFQRLLESCLTFHTNLIFEFVWMYLEDGPLKSTNMSMSIFVPFSLSLFIFIGNNFLFPFIIVVFFIYLQLICSVVFSKSMKVLVSQLKWFVCFVFVDVVWICHMSLCVRVHVMCIVLCVISILTNYDFILYEISFWTLFFHPSAEIDFAKFSNFLNVFGCQDIDVQYRRSQFREQKNCMQ